MKKSGRRHEWPVDQDLLKGNPQRDVSIWTGRRRNVFGPRQRKTTDVPLPLKEHQKPSNADVGAQQGTLLPLL